ncbi:uncharacterized protein [Spinacia oleracea]|uniref:F-box domain-containing protein n=1 Tax=Spinacia oleracea TaxID=3562 RepID=A0A9R0KDQ4_SPIOL|nr:uncharacterized protein LOC110805958 [Spinacia oleracea]
MADWSMLPSDLLREIALKSNTIKDLIYFSAVCQSWNDVFSKVKPDWNTIKSLPWLLLAEPKPESLPWLLPKPKPKPEPKHKPEPKRKPKRKLKPKPYNDSTTQPKSGRRNILSMDENKCYKLMVPQTFGKQCWGSEHGWIVMFDADKKAELFNPITKSQLSLPSLQTLPSYPVTHDNYYYYDDDDDYYIDIDDDDYVYTIDSKKLFNMKELVSKATVLKIPNVDELVVMVIHYPQNNLAFARPGDKSWTPVLTSCTDRYLKVYYVMSWNERMVILYRDGSLAYCEIGTCKPETFTSLPKGMLREIVNKQQGDAYVVELGGDLLVVFRYRRYTIKYAPYEYHTTHFEVYKHVWNTTMSWEKVDDLGDFLLFIGHNFSTALHISMAPNCQRNAIYFVDDETYSWRMEYKQGRGHDTGMFDMASGQVIPFYQGRDKISKLFSPVWFTPKF